MLFRSSQARTRISVWDFDLTVKLVVPNRYEVGGRLPASLLDILDEEDEPIVEEKKKVKKSDKATEKKKEPKQFEDLQKDVIEAYLVKLNAGNSVREEINGIKGDINEIKKYINNKFDQVINLLDKN